MAKILVVDDENNIVELVQFIFSKEGLEVISARDGSTALKKAEREKPDLILLDLMLPEIDGLEVCRSLRKAPETACVPIIILTAKSEELDKVIGLEMGADDYVTKPFSPRELVARVKARLRKRHLLQAAVPERNDKEIHYGPLVIKPAKYEVLAGARKIDLTLKEFELLLMLVSHPGKVFTRDYLLSSVWGFDYSNDTRTVDVHIHHLRQKIEAEGVNAGYIETVRGVGYRFKELL